MDAGDGGGVGGVGVDVVDGDSGAYALDEAGGGVDHERGAYDDENIGFVNEFDGFLDVGYGFLEEDDVGTHGVAVLAACGRRGLQVVDVEGLDIVGVGDGAYFHQLAVEVEDVGGTSAFVEVVDVLGDDVDVVVFFELDEGAVGVVGEGFD